MVIVSFARIDTILKIVRHLQRSHYLHEILVAWNNQQVRDLRLSVISRFDMTDEHFM